MIKATYIDHMGSDLSVVNAARVSFGKVSDWNEPSMGKASGLSDRDAKLVRYLAVHKHISPFGHAFCTWHVKAPVFVARQLVKHKFLRWNEISRRYVDDEPEFYKPDVWRGRSADKKQGSDGEIKIENYMPMLISNNKCQIMPSDQFGNTYDSLNDFYDHSESLYDALLKMNVAPEQARMVLPQSTMTEWYWSGSLDAFADMCNLRCTGDTQLETRLVANQICDKMRELFPVSWLALRGL
jgi:thymidylate synthase (FAD)